EPDFCQSFADQPQVPETDPADVRTDRKLTAVRAEGQAPDGVGVRWLKPGQRPPGGGLDQLYDEWRQGDCQNPAVSADGAGIRNFVAVLAGNAMAQLPGICLPDFEFGNRADHEPLTVGRNA